MAIITVREGWGPIRDNFKLFVFARYVLSMNSRLRLFDFEATHKKFTSGDSRLAGHRQGFERLRRVWEWLILDGAGRVKASYTSVKNF
ncbi:unnamed protein product [Periconia digitata]|uniref:Uncharacterized protein n=1 Tax=Periconia digitata TaxID=1303443 RepID=A0A9W4U7V9_9PLEO|nr:unnamed protein product [Periconia digitata]